MSDLNDGFLFALHIIDSLGVQFDSHAVKSRVADVANGLVVLGHTPEEELRNIQLNAPVAVDEIQTLSNLRKFFDNAKAKNSLIAQRISQL
jgi:hypothetical protein